MAVAFDAVASTTGSDVTSLSWTHTPVGTPTAAGMGFYAFDSGNATSATYNSTTFGAAVATTSDASGDNCQLFGLANPASGARSVTVAWAVSTFPVAGSVTVTGSDTTTCYRAGSATSSAGSSTALQVTIASNTDDLVYSVGGQDPCGTLTAGNTQRWNQASGGLDGIGQTEAGGASVAITATASGSNPWCITGASFLAAAAGSASASAALLILNPNLHGNLYGLRTNL